MKTSWIRRMTSAAAVAAAFTMLLSGCGSSSTGGASGKTVEEPAAGYSSDVDTASYAMPKKDGKYNNPKDYDEVKDGGELTLPSTYTPSWNNLSVDGNTLYMQEMWAWYMPSLATLDAKGNLTWNTDYITDVTVTSEDPLTITYTINPKAKWNDGTDIDWTAFKATWQAMNGSNDAFTPASTDGFSSISNVEEGADPKQAVVTFAQPYYPWQAIFGTLMHPDSANPETFTSGWTDNPHNEWAAGPFIVDHANKDEAVFTRNPNWWGKKPKLEKVTYKYMEDTAQLNAFKNGEIDAVSFATNNSLQTIKDTKDIQIRLGYSKSTDVLIYNGKSGALQDQNVRKALVQAYDADQMNKIHFQGLNWTPTAAGSEIFPVFQEGYEDNRPDEAKKTDVAAAKKTLEAAGYTMGDDGYYAKDGKTLEVRYTYFGDAATGTAMAKAYQQMMKSAGIKIDLDNRDTAKFADTVNSGDYDVLPMAWSASSPFGQTAVPQLYASNSDSNYSFVGNSTVDELTKVPGTIEDQAEAVKAANKAEKEALKLFGTMPTDVPPSFVAVKKGLANVGPAGFTGNGSYGIDPILTGWEK